MGRGLTIVWIPGHHRITANDRGKEGGLMAQKEVKFDCGMCASLIKKNISEFYSPRTKIRTMRLRVRVNDEREVGLTREERMDLTRFRSGHHTKLRR